MTTTTETFNDRYYKTGNYRRYLSRKFEELANDLIIHVPLSPKHRIIDYGCGYGGLLAVLSRHGYKHVCGTDISQWAIEYGKDKFPDLAPHLHYYSRDLLDKPKDVVLFLDVLEHMPESEIAFTLKLAAKELKIALVLRIPVSDNEGEDFVLDVSNHDRTHIACHCKKWWMKQLSAAMLYLDHFLDGPAIYNSDGVLAGVWKPQ